MTNPEFIVFSGPMFSSKTSRLLMTLERYKYQKKNVVVFKPRIDNRYSETHVVSHCGWSYAAVVVGSGAEMLEVLQRLDVKPDVVAVDEMFMIDGAAEVLIWLYRQLKMTIVISSLDLSASLRPFDELKKVLPWATHLEKCSSVCVVCGKDAYFTHKKADDDIEIKVGGSEIYEPRCYQHVSIMRQDT